MSTPQVIYMGTPEFAVPPLRAVAQACNVVAVVTGPDRRQGRGRKWAPTPVAQAAEALGLDVLKPERMSAAATREALGAREADLFAVVAFGAILGPKLLKVPRLGSINLHGSLLPDYRGAAPIARALWDGRETTGVTTIWMDDGIDTGDMILSAPLTIEPQDDAARLSERLAGLGGPLLAKSLVLAYRGEAPRTPQPDGSGSYSGKLSKEDGIVNWGLDATTVWHRQRAVTPWPGAATQLRGKRVTLIRTVPVEDVGTSRLPGTVLDVEAQVTVACQGSVLRLLRVKPESRSEMDAGDWANGVRLEVDERLGEPLSEGPTRG